MSTVAELKSQHNDALDRAQGVLSAAERNRRGLTPDEKRMVDSHMHRADRLKAEIDEKQKSERATTPEAARAALAKFDHIPRSPALLEMRASTGPSPERVITTKTRFTPGYHAELFHYLRTGHRGMEAALYEGASVQGGYAATIEVDREIVPLAPTDFAVRQLARQINLTTTSVLVPQKAAITPLSQLKGETNAFPSGQPTLSQFTATPAMVGVQMATSLQALEDIPGFQAFLQDDASLAMQEEEESLFLSGTGSGQPQGILGNTGAGVTEEPDTNGNAVSISGTLDLIGQLNAMYQPNASWLMSRPTSIVIRKAQVEQNLFFPAWTRVGAQDFLHGYPVHYSADMPTAARGNTPVLFGDFKAGYLIADMGGPAIRVKVIEQYLASQGVIYLLFFRRTDGRVRRSEAIQQYNVALS
jgi:HK97 family phage major capsid protein